MYLPLLAAALFSVSARAGSDPCKGIDLTEDKFTHKQTATVKGIAFSMPWNLEYSVEFSNGEAGLKMALLEPGMHTEVLPAAYKVMVLLADGSVTELGTKDETKPTPAADAYSGIYTIWMARFPLDKSLATKLAAQDATAIRAALPGGDSTWNLKKKHAKDLARALTCYASMLP